MNLERPELARGLLAAAAVVLVIGLIGAVTIDSDDSTSVAAGDKSTMTQSDTTNTTAGAVAPGGTGTTTPAPTGTTASTRALSATTTPGSAEVPKPGPAKPPAPGTYTYKQVTDVEGATNGESDAKIEALPEQNGAARRRVTYDDGQGSSISNEETWTADAVKVVASHIVTAQGTVDCSWQPPILVFQLPLDVGRTWSSDSTCTTMVQGTQVTIRRVAQFKVTGKMLDKIGETSVATWVIESTGSTTVRSAFFNTDTTEAVTRRFAAARGLVTYEKATATASGRTGTSERTLQNLTPK